MSDTVDERIRELSRWNRTDLKGPRRTYYTKEVLNQNQDIMTIVKTSNLEKVNTYSDGHPCLMTRKKLMRIRVYINNFACLVTQNRYFETFIILVIGLNCITLAQSDSTVEETDTQKTIGLIF